jgi:threonine/homoserine/homoserine lactone efflux protein
MSSMHAIIAFTLAAGLLTITPGLDTALVLRTAAVEGPRRGMQAAFGIMLGLFTWALAASIGLGALLAASRLAYDMLRVVGALYMLWLGSRMVAASLRASPQAESAKQQIAPTGQSWVLRGLMTNLLNPKVGVFYVSFLPLFVPSGVNVTAFSLMLAGIHITQGLAWFWLLTTAMRPLARWVRNPNVTRALDGITGSVLIAFGLGLFLERR